ncbi:MKRN2 opposite strand, tandem duplicate 1 [Polymixia lowei]
MDVTVLRFRHCGRIIYTFNNKTEPDAGSRTGRTGEPGRTNTCPACQEPLRFGLLDAPVVLPSPFSDGHKTSCSFLIASRLGPTFISEQSDSELHVGISNSEGVVFSYTEVGVQCQQQGWEQCLTIPLVTPDNHSSTLGVPSNYSSHLVNTGNSSLIFKKYWDRQLEMFASLDAWTPQRFVEERESGSCCYGFALAFINQLRRSEGIEPISRNTFTIQYILPRMTTSSKYLSVYQHIQQHGYYSTQL